MSRRRPKGELQFGSDSFLDVVANIVGILIILIVIAGLRVSQTPVVVMPAAHPSTSEPSSTPVASVPSTVTEDVLEAKAPPTTVVPPPQKTESRPVRSPLPGVIVPQELVDLTGSLEAEITSLRREDASLEADLNRSSLQHNELIERQKAIRAMLAQSTGERDAMQKRAVALEADLALARESLSRLTQQVAALEDKTVNVKTLEHKITPISRAVNGREKHYRLERNRVAEVPVDELVLRLKEQIDRRKDWLVKTRQHQGTIGPVQGFSMQYLVRVDSLSGLEEMRTGHGGYRISLSHWDIVPEPETKGETEDVALRKGSKFYQSILGAAPDTTLTFWVYPDSFHIYRQLQKFTHDHGFSVAGRPLPPGIPISGSPNGSKSASQ